jgi:TolA-binding protein
MIQQGDAAGAAGHIATYMATARDPISRSRGIQAQARISLAAKRYEEARTQTEESLLLQPEGKLNAEGRLLLGDILAASGDQAEAAKAFLTVAVLYDDPQVTPKALMKAAEAYRKAGNTFEAEKALKELQQRYPNYKKSPKSKDNP